MVLTRSASASLSNNHVSRCSTPPPTPQPVHAPSAPKKPRNELSRAWATARKWRAERDQAYAQLERRDASSTASMHNSELSRVWSLARRWRAERDAAYAKLKEAK